MISGKFNMDYTPLITSIKLAAITSVLLLCICLLTSYLLIGRNNKLKSIVNTLASLPLVLPPTVLGFYILIFLSPNYFLGAFIKKQFDINLVFNYLGILIASCIFSFPFMFQAIKNGEESISHTLIESSYILGKSRFRTFIHVVIPNIKSFILTGFIMSFAHTLGEFGVVLMVGGNIPGKTKVISIAIYEKVEELDFNSANHYSIILLIFSFVVLFLIQMMNNKRMTSVKH